MDDTTYNQAVSIKEEIGSITMLQGEIQSAINNNDRIQVVNLNFMNDPITIDDPDEELVDMIKDWCTKRIKRLKDQFAEL